MKKEILSIFCTTLFFLCANPVSAQSITPDWARQIYGSNGGGGWGSTPATDKHGNVYALSYENGTVNVDGQLTPDSTSTTVLTSWDCDGNLRWMRSFGATNSSGNNGAMSVQTDTSEGIYISGFATTFQTSSNIYWDTDTAVGLPANRLIEYLIKYNSQGQFQWFRILKDSSAVMFPRFSNLSVSPGGDVWMFALLDTGVYASGTFTINTRKYYAVNYNASGSFQAAIPLDITPPTPPALGVGPLWEVDPSTNRFYCTLFYDTSYGSLAVGNIPIAPLTGSSSRTILGAFDGNGQNLWVQQGSLSTSMGGGLGYITFGNDGTLYLSGTSEPGNVFCADTTPSSAGTYNPAFIMALDTNGNRLWSNYSANAQDVNIWGISYVNNVIAVVGRYNGTLAWNGYTITDPVPLSFYTYMLRLNAATGAAVQLSSFNSSGGLFSGGGTLDENGNLYINGAFSGNLVFGNDNLSSYPNSSYSNSFLLKYKNVVCNCDLLQPAFNFSSSAATTFQFTYTGQTPYASISWDFGDGATVTGVTSPSHTYAAAGTYPVCVTVTNGCGSNTSCKYVSFTTGIKDAGGAFSSVSIYPNPAQDQLTITSLPQGTTVEVLDITGRLLKRVESVNAELHLNVEGLSAGVHLLRFTDKDGRRGSSMFVKQ